MKPLTACPNLWCPSHSREDPQKFELNKPVLTPTDPPGHFRVFCPRCVVSGPYYESPEEASQAWNLRPVDPMLGQAYSTLVYIREASECAESRRAATEAVCAIDQTYPTFIEEPNP